MSKNIEMNYFNGNEYEVLYPLVDLNNSVSNLTLDRIEGNIPLDRIENITSIIPDSSKKWSIIVQTGAITSPAAVTSINVGSNLLNNYQMVAFVFNNLIVDYCAQICTSRSGGNIIVNLVIEENGSRHFDYGIAVLFLIGNYIRTLGEGTKEKIEVNKVNALGPTIYLKDVQCDSLIVYGAR